jgi:hypothetical protein
VIRNFASFGGGGAYSSLLTDCVVSNNTAGGLGANGYGGGVYLGMINNSLISSNNAYDGGGACSNVLNHCVLQNNLAYADGGGVYGSTLADCIISNNTAEYGGGAYCGSLNNCLVTGNAASYGGAVMANVNLPPTNLKNCTVFGNSASVQAGGLLSSALIAPSLLYATNCIVYGNDAPTGSNYFYGFSGELTFNYCCTAPWPTNGVGNLTNDPGLINPAAGNFQLQPDSPCINAGNNFDVTNATDLAGNPRIVGGTVDIGAYEYQTPTSVISYAYLQQYGLPTDGSVDYADLDGTAFDVYQDWVAGLNPTNPASVLAMLTPAATINTNGLTVTWQSVIGISYQLLRSTNLTAFVTLQNSIPGQSPTTSYKDTSATNNFPYFYRVGVLAP